jgi:PAS domain S-box-containing protein
MMRIEVAFLVLYTAPLFLNYAGKIIASRIYFNAIILVHLFILSILLGKDSIVYVFFIPTIMAPFVLFEFSQRRVIILLSMLNVTMVSVLYTYIFRYYSSPLQFSSEQTDLLNKLIFYVSIGCCVAIVYSVVYVNERTTRQLDLDKEILGLQMEAIFENSNDAKFLVRSSDRKIVKVNKRGIELLEADSVEKLMIEYSFSFRKSRPGPGETERIHEQVAEKGYYEDEVQYKTFKGNEFWASVFVRPLTIHNEKFYSIRLTDVSEKRIAKQKLEIELKEKELLLAEIHHRVKNNLAIISALINLQIEDLKDEQSKKIFEETKDRIYSMSLIHNQLYQNKSFERIEFAQYVSNFCSYLSKSYCTKCIIEIVERTEKLHLDIKTAIPCALILNELVTNSFKHAFNNQVNGKIEVGLKKENGAFVFWVSDTGSGMDSAQLASNSMGMNLVTSLVEQIDGKLDYRNEKGSHFLITFN